MTLKTTLDNSIYQEQKIIQNKQFAEIHPEDDQSIPIETSSWNQRFFSEPPQLI